MRERPGMMYRLPAMHHYDQRPFATDEIDQKLEESVYGEGLSKSRDMSVEKLDACGA